MVSIRQYKLWKESISLPAYSTIELSLPGLTSLWSTTRFSLVFSTIQVLIRDFSPIGADFVFGCGAAAGVYADIEPHTAGMKGGDCE